MIYVGKNQQYNLDKLCKPTFPFYYVLNPNKLTKSPEKYHSLVILKIRDTASKFRYLSKKAKGSCREFKKSGRILTYKYNKYFYDPVTECSHCRSLYKISKILERKNVYTTLFLNMIKN